MLYLYTRTVWQILDHLHLFLFYVSEEVLGEASEMMLILK